MAAVHHVELWVPDFAAARQRGAWILGRLSWDDYQDWAAGHSWRAPDGAYLVIEQSPDLTGDRHERTLPDLNHLALNAPSRAVVDDIVAGSGAHGWHLLFADRHPYAGGPDHYAAFLADDELEIVAP